MKINKYNISKETKNSSTIRGDVITNTTTSVNTELETHTIYGQPYNGTQDVGGDMSNITSITTVGGDINVKATTEESLGFTGNLEGIKAYGVCLLTSVSDAFSTYVNEGSSCGGCGSCHKNT